MTIIREKNADWSRITGMSETTYDAALKHWEDRQALDEGTFEYEDPEGIDGLDKEDAAQLFINSRMYAMENNERGRKMYWDEWKEWDIKDNAMDHVDKLFGKKTLKCASVPVVGCSYDLICLFNEKFIGNPELFQRMMIRRDWGYVTIRAKELEPEAPIVTKIGPELLSVDMANNVAASITSAFIDTYTARDTKAVEQTPKSRVFYRPQASGIMISKDMTSRAVKLTVLHLKEMGLNLLAEELDVCKNPCGTLVGSGQRNTFTFKL